MLNGEHAQAEGAYMIYLVGRRHLWSQRQVKHT